MTYRTHKTHLHGTRWGEGGGGGGGEGHKSKSWGEGTHLTMGVHTSKINYMQGKL